jgi:hypothetical protein
MPIADRWRQADLSVPIVVHKTIASGGTVKRRFNTGSADAV